jgi:predicted nucleotidyltransferase
VRIFGSFARGEQRPDSDIDLLVDLPLSVSLLDIASLKQELQERLGRRVDIITEDGLSPYLRERVLREALTL